MRVRGTELTGWLSYQYAFMVDVIDGLKQDTGNEENAAISISAVEA